MADPYLHGGGIHIYPSQGKLNMHLDYSIHPITKKERRINIIIYLNKIWEDEWGGHLELWDNIENPTFIKRLNPEYNTAVIFQTSDGSYHGIPNKINCPSNFSRNSIAIYYVSEPRNNVKHRYKAKFFITNDKEKNDTRLKQLIEIRNNRRLTSKDLETIYPDWKEYF
ncbi:MAG: 2OG-Fe(II) oxygenase [Thermoplasmata archaeon]